MLRPSSLALATSLAVSFGLASAAPNSQPDSIVALVKHTVPDAADPVRVQLERWKVVKATFDPKKVEGGTATIEIDATSVKTGSDTLDALSQTAQFLNTKKFPKIVVEIDHVNERIAAKVIEKAEHIIDREFQLAPVHELDRSAILEIDAWNQHGGDYPVWRTATPCCAR